MTFGSWSGRPAAAGLIGLALIMAACAGSSPAASDGRAPVSRPDSAPSATVTSIEPSIPPSPRNAPLRVLMAGDSVMEEVAPPVEAAFGSDVSVQFVLSPQLIRDEAQRAIWRSTLADLEPDVIVVLVSHWERLRLGVQTADGFPPMEEYLATIVEPFIDFVTDTGAVLLWLEAPYVAEERRTLIYELQNEAYATAAERHPDADFLATNDLVGGPDGVYSDILVAADGTTTRVRNTDGNHLCPDGAARIADRVVTRIGREFETAPVDDWQAGAWRDEPPFAEPESCPAG